MVDSRCLLKRLLHFSSGPSVNKAVLLELQKKKAMEMEQRNKAVYNNTGFERNENHIGSEPDNATTQPSAAPAEPEKQAQDTSSMEQRGGHQLYPE